MPPILSVQAALEIGFATVLKGATQFRNGNVSETFRGQVYLTDGTTKNVFLKDLGPKELSNELLSTVLARVVGLPTPEIYLGLVPEGVLTVQHGPALPNGGRLVLASSDVQAPNLAFQINNFPDGPEALTRAVISWCHLGQLYGFDTWAANIDRHPGNLLFGTKGEIWLIDHGYCYTGPNWKAADLIPDNQYRNKLSEWLTQVLPDARKSSLAADVDLFSAQIGSVDVADAITRSRIRGLLSEDDVLALEVFLTRRVAVTPSQTKHALGVLT
jgi:hypothetical protein